MLQSEIKIVELQFHKLQRIIIIYFFTLIVTIIHWPINYMLQSDYMQMFVQVVLLLLLLIKQIVEQTTIQSVGLNIHSVLCY